MLALLMFRDQRREQQERAIRASRDRRFCGDPGRRTAKIPACYGMSDRHVTLMLDRPGERLDRALADSLPELSRAQCQRLIKDGKVTIGGGALRPARCCGEEKRFTLSSPIPR